MLQSDVSDAARSPGKACSGRNTCRHAWNKHWLRTTQLNVNACQRNSAFSNLRRPYHNGAPRDLAAVNSTKTPGLRALRAHSWRWSSKLQTSSSSRAYRGDGQYGDFSVTQYAPFQQALASPFLTDLNLDFDKTYLAGRRNLSVVPSSLKQSRQVGGVEAFLRYRMHLQEAGEDLDLLYCALLIARHAHPDLDSQQVAAQVESLAADVRRAHLRQPHDSGLSLGQTIGHVLYDQHGFQGNCDDFYDANNHCLNVVLAERKGSPVALALLHLLVAETVGAWCRAVLMPSHCFLKTQQGPGNFLLDPFNKGQVCSAGVVEARLNAIWGFSSPVIRVGHTMISSPRLATKREVLLRLLNNLRESYWGPSSVTGRIRWTGNMGGPEAAEVESMSQRALVITRFMRATGGSPTLLRDEGYILSCLGRHDEASKLLQHYLQECPHAPDIDRVQEFLLDNDGCI